MVEKHTKITTNINKWFKKHTKITTNILGRSSMLLLSSNWPKKVKFVKKTFLFVTFINLYNKMLVENFSLPFTTKVPRNI